MGALEHDDEATEPGVCSCAPCRKRDETMRAARGAGVVRVWVVHELARGGCREPFTACITYGPEEQVRSTAHGASEDEAIFNALHLAGLV